MSIEVTNCDIYRSLSPCGAAIGWNCKAAEEPDLNAARRATILFLCTS